MTARSAALALAAFFMSSCAQTASSDQSLRREGMPEWGLSRPMHNVLMFEETGRWLEEPRIIGGVEARPGDDPWQVAIIFSNVREPRRRAFCGGTLIARNVVVTAAHCVDNGVPARAIQVLAGTVDTATGGDRVDVSEIIIHSDWDPGTEEEPRNYNDIAILHLAREVRTDVRADAIAFADASAEPAMGQGQITRVTGWGAVAERGPMQTKLRTVNAPIVANVDCNDRVAYGDGDPTTPELVTSGMLCVGREGGGVDSCQGDSGGPLTMPISGRRTLVGVVSWGWGCARPHKYGVYTRVSHYASWIVACRDRTAACMRL